MSFPIPLDVFDQHVAILGTTGSGKSYTCRAVVEALLRKGRRICVLDYTGVWFGLRSGFPVIIFGGEHADVPLTEAAAGVVARFVADGTQPSIVDLDGLTVGAQQRFVTTFCEELYRLNHRPLHLVFEEVDEYAPQTGAPGAERMIGAVCRIFQRGRKKGFRAVAITQRPANCHKRVLAQCNALLALRLTHPRDRAAVDEWVRGHADGSAAEKFIAALPSLPRGNGLAWAPELNLLKVVRFPAIATFDSMKAPEEGDTGMPEEWKAVDLAAIKAELAQTIQAAAENDPVTLKQRLRDSQARIRELQGELDHARQSTKADPQALKSAEAKGYAAGWREGIDEALKAFPEPAQMLEQISAAGLAFRDAVRRSIWSIATKMPLAPEDEPTEPEAPAPSAPPARPKAPVTVAHVNGLSPAELRVLKVLAQRYPAKFTLAGWAMLAGMKRTGGTWQRYVRQLRAAGLLDEEGGLVACAPAGLDVVGVVPAEPRGSAEIIAMWKGRLGAGPAKLLDILTSAYPDKVHRANLADRVSMVSTGGTFQRYMRELAANGLTEKIGASHVKASAMLFRDPQ